MNATCLYNAWHAIYIPYRYCFCYYFLFFWNQALNVRHSLARIRFASLSDIVLDLQHNNSFLKGWFGGPSSKIANNLWAAFRTGCYQLMWEEHEEMELGRKCISFSKVRLSHRMEPTARPDPEGYVKEREGAASSMQAEPPSIHAK